MKIITHFYFDMDGVLADFPRFAQENSPYAHDEHTPENKKKFKEWLASIIDEQKVFENLEPSPHISDMIRLKNRLKKKGIIVSTLTSLGGHHLTTTIHAQKKRWLDKHGFDDILYLAVNECHEKQFLAHKTAFLLDDHVDNCFDFIFAGGQSMRYSIQEHDVFRKRIKSIV